MAADFGKRFAELLQQGREIEEAKQRDPDYPMAVIFVIDNSSYLTWRVKAGHLIEMVCGKDSHHFVTFLETEQMSGLVGNLHKLTRHIAVLRAAKEDYEGGYLNKIRNLIQSEVFSNELEQAEELLSAGYHAPAAVVTGVVLETTLRQMCADNHVETDKRTKLDKMNADLVRARAYNAVVQKQVTAWAAIRNSAAHGKADEFKPDDVAAMIRDVQRFVGDRLS